jgi:PAS domain S-box-containing protein
MENEKNKDCKALKIITNSITPTIIISGGEIIEFNKAMVKLTGYKKADIDNDINKFFQKIFPNPDYRDSVININTKGQFIDFKQDEIDIIKKNKDYVHTKFSTHDFNDDECLTDIKIIQIEDLTSKKYYQEALRQSRLRYKMVVDNQIELICRYHPDGNMTFVNKTYRNYFGKSESELIGEKFCQEMSDKDREEFNKMLMYLIPENPGNIFKHNIVLNNEVRWLEWFTKAIFDDNSRLVEYQSVGRDITNNKKTEEQLKEKENKYRALLERNNDGIILIKPDGKIIEANYKACLMFEYNKEELTGMSIERLVPDEEKEDSKNRIKSLMNGEQLEIYERIFITGTGKKIYTEINTALVYDVNGNPNHIQIIARDISNRKKQEEELKQYRNQLERMVEIRTKALKKINEKLKKEIEERKKTESNLISRNSFIHTILDSLPIGLAVNCMDKKEIKYMNKEFMSIHGWPEEEIEDSSKDLFKAVGNGNSEDGDGEVINRTLNYIADGFISNGDWKSLKILTKNGEEKFVLTKKIPVYEENLIISTFQNITDKKQAEEKIKRSIKEKDMLLKEIHHRVKNNLQMITSLLRIQKSVIEDNKTIYTIDELFNRIQTLALIYENLYINHNLETIDIKEYIRSIIFNLFSSNSRLSKNIKREVHIENIYLNIEIAIQCGLLVNEIVSNSIKYAFKKGIDGKIRVEFYQEDDSYILVISDNGIGMPSDTDLENHSTMGLKMINLLVKKLRAKIELFIEQGTKYKVTFKKSKFISKPVI